MALADFQLDPMVYLRANRLEQMVLNEVITQASKRLSERKTKEITAIGAAVANALGKLFRRKK